MGLMFLAACATTGPKYGGVFVPKEYEERFKPGPEGGAKLVWIKPGVDFSKYKKVMVDYVVFALAPDSDYKGINADELKELADSASKAFVEAIKEKWPVVSEPGPDVIRLRTAITDLKQSRPVISAVTSVVPVGLAINIVKRGATGSWTGSGMTKGEAMVLDSMTNEVIAAAYDDYSAKFTERFSKWGSVEDAFKHWGEVFATRLEVMRGIKK
jgi:hypothetical protein